MNYKIQPIAQGIGAILKMGLVFFICLMAKELSAQTVATKTDSLEKAFEQAKSDTTKFNISLDLIDRYKNIDSAKTNAYLLEAEKLGKTPRQKMQYLSAKAAFLIVYGKMEQANALLFEALKIAKAKNYRKDEAKIYNNLGVSYLQLSNNKQALKYQLLALKIREELNDEAGLESSNSNIGNVYFDIMEDDKALVYYKKALFYAQKLGMQAELGILYNNIAGIFYDKDDYKQTKSYLLKSLTYKLKTNNITGQITTLNSLGDVCSSLNSFKESEDYYRQAMELANKVGDDMNKANILNSLGHLYRYKNEFEKAVDFQNRALKLSKAIKYRNIHKDALLELSIDYRNLKNYQKAYEFYREYVTLKDSIAEESSKTEIAELQTKYDTEHKEQKITLLNKENTIQKLALKSKNLSIGIIVSIFCIALIMAVLFYNSYKLRQQKALQAEILKQQDLASKAILEAEEKERKRIAGDLHDGLGQMFSTVKLNLSGLENQVEFKDEQVKANFFKTINLVDTSCKELRSISHQMASDVLIKLGIVAAIKDFIQNIDQNLLKTNFQSVGLDERISSGIETVLYRIVQESVNNVIKHAKATHLDIQLLKEAHELTLIIEDNGVGFNINEMENFNGIGLRNIKSRIEYLKGTIDFDSAPNRGTVISIFVPLV